METSVSINKEMFEGSEVRVVDYNGKSYMPVMDMAKAMAYERRHLMKVVEQNKDTFINGKAYIHLDTKGGKQSMLCLNREGVIALFMGLKTNMIKDSFRKELIIKFRQWAVNTLGKIVDGKLIVTQPDNDKKTGITRLAIGQIVTDHLQIADALCKYAHVERGVAMTVAISLAEYETGIKLTAYRNLIPRDEERKVDSIPLLNPTDIGKELGFGGSAGQTVNNLLFKLGYIEKVGDQWVLTPKGKKIGESFAVVGTAESGKPYSRYQIKYQPRIVNIISKHIFREIKPTVPPVNQGLLTGFLS